MMQGRQRLLFWLVISTVIRASLSLVMSASRTGVVRLSESVWRASAALHTTRIRELLQPGLVAAENAPESRQRRHDNRPPPDSWIALDPKNPTYNFLVEYYGLKGTKGPRRLARWSPDFSCLTAEQPADDQQQLGTAASAYGILLEGATEDDLGSTLHLRGALPQDDGILYSPRQFYATYTADDATRAATAFVWYQSILQATLQAEPVLHCFGLHEWAMQYWPVGADPPPSAKYQQHLSLRVSRQTINDTVERKGISCTHVDALRFFAPSAAPLNHHGQFLQRVDQLRLEQPACVHAHMDLLKIALKLQPYCNAILLQRILALTLRARQLDVAASPYDVSSFGIRAIPVETPQGRADYKRQQLQLMHDATPIRQDLLRAYETFMEAAFDKEVLERAIQSPLAERFAVAGPGSEPWRRNLAV